MAAGVFCVAQTATFSLLVHFRAALREYKVLAGQMERIWKIHKVSLSVAGDVVAGESRGPPEENPAEESTTGSE